MQRAAGEQGPLLAGDERGVCVCVCVCVSSCEGETETVVINVVLRVTCDVLQNLEDACANV